MFENKEKQDNQSGDRMNHQQQHLPSANSSSSDQLDRVLEESEEDAGDDLNNLFYSTEGEGNARLPVDNTFIWITTVAAPPLQVYPILRALHLIRWQLQQKKKNKNVMQNPKKRVTIIIPWVDKVEDRELIYGDYVKVIFDDGATGRKQQASYIREWVAKETDMAEEVKYLRIRFYPAKYDMKAFVKYHKSVKEREKMDSVKVSSSSKKNFLPSCSDSASSRLPISLEVLRALAKEESETERHNIQILHIDIEGNEIGYTLKSLLSPDINKIERSKPRKISFDDEHENIKKKISGSQQTYIRGKIQQNTETSAYPSKTNGVKQSEMKNGKLRQESIANVRKEILIPSYANGEERSFFQKMLKIFGAFVQIFRTLVFVVALFIIYTMLIDEQYLINGNVSKLQHPGNGRLLI